MFRLTNIAIATIFSSKECKNLVDLIKIVILPGFLQS